MAEATDVATAVARRARALRAERAWSLDTLAARAGLSKGVLVALEQGRGNPNLGTLIRVSDAFGIPLAKLVQVEEPPQVRLLPPHQHVVLWTGPGGGTGRLVAGTEARPSVELWRWELRAGEGRDSDAHLPGTREVVQVEAGTLQLTVDGRAYPVPAGSAAVFAADTPHRYANAGEEPLLFTMVVLDP